jgi:hypothetical protein
MLGMPRGYWGVITNKVVVAVEGWKEASRSYLCLSVLFGFIVLTFLNGDAHVTCT